MISVLLNYLSLLLSTVYSLSFFLHHGFYTYSYHLHKLDFHQNFHFLLILLDILLSTDGSMSLATKSGFLITASEDVVPHPFWLNHPARHIIFFSNTFFASSSSWKLVQINNTLIDKHQQSFWVHITAPPIGFCDTLYMKFSWRAVTFCDMLWTLHPKGPTGIANSK